MNHPKLILICLLFSGLASLGYETLWIRLLSFSFGSSHISFAAVLAVFFAGLAFGSLIGGKIAHRLQRPLFTYGIIEIIMGITGMMLYFVIHNLDGFFARIDPGIGLAGMLVRLAVSAPLLLVPTILMGMTLPIIARSSIVRRTQTGVGTSLIYGCNTLGAALGVLLTSFVFFRLFGMLGSNIVLALLNFLAGGLAIFFSKAEGTLQTASSEAESTVPNLASPTSKSARNTKILISTIAFLSGFSFLTFEIIWGKLFSNFLGGSLYAINTVLLVALLGIALGSLLASQIFKRGWSLERSFIFLQLTSMASIVLILSQLRLIMYLIASLGELGATVSQPLYLQIACVFFVLLVPTIAAGASFPVLLHILEKNREQISASLGQISFINTSGSIIASLLMGFYILPSFGSEAAIYLGLFMMFLIIAGAYLLTHSSPSFTLRGKLPTLAAVALALVLLINFTGFERNLLAYKASTWGKSFAGYSMALTEDVSKQAFFSEGKSAVIKLNKGTETIGMTNNGLGQGGYNLLPPHHILESLLVAYLPTIHAPSNPNALVVGLGMGVTVDALLQFDAAHVTVLELEEKVALAVNQAWENKSPLLNNKVQLEINDARHFLNVNRIKNGKKYDLITSMPAHPWVAAPIFTEEFFQIAHDNLSEQGVFSTWFGAPQNQDISKHLIGSFTKVFSNYVVYEIPDVGALYLLGSKSPLKLDAERLSSFAKHPLMKNHTRWTDAATLASYALGNGIQSQESAFSQSNTDDNAYVEIHYPLQTVSKIATNELQSTPTESALKLPQAFLQRETIVGGNYNQIYQRALMVMLGMNQDGLISDVWNKNQIERVKTLSKHFSEQWQKADVQLVQTIIAWREGNLNKFLAEQKDVWTPQNLAELNEAKKSLLTYVFEQEGVVLTPDANFHDINRLNLLAKRQPEKAMAWLKEHDGADSSFPEAIRIMQSLLKNPTRQDELELFRTVTVPWLQNSPAWGLTEMGYRLAQSLKLSDTSTLLSESIANARKLEKSILIQKAMEAEKNKQPELAIKRYHQAQQIALLNNFELRELYRLEKTQNPQADLHSLETQLRERGYDDEWLAAFRELCCKSPITAQGESERTAH